MRSYRHREELQMLHEELQILHKELQMLHEELQILHKELQILQGLTDATRSYRHHFELQTL